MRSITGIARSEGEDMAGEPFTVRSGSTGPTWCGAHSAVRRSPSTGPP